MQLHRSGMQNRQRVSCQACRARKFLHSTGVQPVSCGGGAAYSEVQSNPWQELRSIQSQVCKANRKGELTAAHSESGSYEIRSRQGQQVNIPRSSNYLLQYHNAQRSQKEEAGQAKHMFKATTLTINREVNSIMMVISKSNSTHNGLCIKQHGDGDVAEEVEHINQVKWAAQQGRGPCIAGDNLGDHVLG
eukprot:1143894-Pelagomonas_calceolata.AAC.7